MGADVLTAGEGAGGGMARVTEARGDRLSPLNLVGGASHREGWHRGAAGMQFHQPGEREHADESHSGGQQRRQARRLAQLSNATVASNSTKPMTYSKTPTQGIATLRAAKPRVSADAP